ncbi:NUDIX domain-containing protein [Streptomyces rubiginosohelvolus]|uniref:NUDIX domain-containing protein n=1 Tax=Streptomyces rubiginosohelvolus TaxID=67362 RepID=UPI0036CC3DB7
MSTESHDEAIRYTADVVLLAAGHVLLIQRRWDPHAASWALPGGHCDAGETSLQAAVRELEEETGITIPADELRQVGAFDGPGRDPRGRYITVAYTATLTEPVAPTPMDDAVDARWWPLTDLPPLAFDHADILTATTRTAASVARAPQDHPGAELIALLRKAGLDANTARERIRAHALMVSREQQYLADADGPHTRLAYRLEHREPGMDLWQPGTPGIGARWSYASHTKASARLTEAQEQWPEYEHQLVEVTTTVTEKPLLLGPGAASAPL